MSRQVASASHRAKFPTMRRLPDERVPSPAPSTAMLCKVGPIAPKDCRHANPRDPSTNATSRGATFLFRSVLGTRATTREASTCAWAAGLSLDALARRTVHRLKTALPQRFENPTHEPGSERHG